jgi:hypothetical protein
MVDTCSVGGALSSRSGVGGLGASNTGSDSSPGTCSPGIGKSGSGGGGPGDVVVGDGVDLADPREGAAGGDCGGW